MNREIKYRGKFKKDGEWEYGGIRFGDMGQAYILPHGASHRVELVNRDSVGQFTGLHDKNGKEIYEGDIVEYETPGGDMRGEIKYVPELTAYYIFYRKGEPDQLSAVEDGISPILEVIGNIWEHPNLLESK